MHTARYRADIDVTAPVVFAGYGITAPELHYDDYRGIDVHGKIVLLFDHEPQETDPNSIFNGTGNTRYATTRVKVLERAGTRRGRRADRRRAESQASVEPGTHRAHRRLGHARGADSGSSDCRR